MSFAPGTRIGAYEIRSPLGAGGVGEVYRARDTKLGRQVAVKILPDDFLRDPARVARFQREAQVLAALNHPHIAQIDGFDDTSDIHALVMELVEGPTLGSRSWTSGSRSFSGRLKPAPANVRAWGPVLAGSTAQHRRRLPHPR